MLKQAREATPAVAPLFLVLLASCGETTAFREPRVITSSGPSVPFKHAVWRALNPTDSGAILIQKDGIELDIGGGRLSRGEVVSDRLDGPADLYMGRGIVVKGAKNVTIRNMKITGFKVAIYAEDTPGLTIENCDVSNNYRQHLKSTPQKEDESDWLCGHENDNDEWLRYGAGIYLKNCPGATIKNCRARDGQNGICLVRCDGATVIGNDMSFMSGWGLAMWRSCRCKVIGNRFDYCVRGYSHGVYARGQDSAGILVYEQCTDNVFAYNHATHCGDGFFLYAGNEMVKKSGEGGCNRNLVYQNDFSYAVANGIEATFSDSNCFLNNQLGHCEHGIWAGYSTKSVVGGNEIRDCAHGLSIEHGRGNQIFRNDFELCGNGVRLWWDNDQDLLSSPYAARNGADSTNESVERNVFLDCSLAVDCAGSKEFSLVQNRFAGCSHGFVAEEGTTIKQFDRNSFIHSSVENKIGTIITGLNELPDVSLIIGPIAQRRLTVGEEFMCGNYFGFHVLRASPLDLLEARRAAIALTYNCPPDCMRTAPQAALRDIPEGKEHIVIDEWGPVDPTRPRRTKPKN